MQGGSVVRAPARLSKPCDRSGRCDDKVELLTVAEGAVFAAIYGGDAGASEAQQGQLIDIRQPFPSLGEGTNATAASACSAIKASRTSPPTSNAVGPMAGPSQARIRPARSPWRRCSPPVRHPAARANRRERRPLRCRPDCRTAPADSRRSSRCRPDPPHVHRRHPHPAHSHSRG